ncbi:MAG: ShlB/FhaC/HecB family hemolysin secretion/activation protein [Candidatus Marinamargulisbacteria bacterium]
MKIVISVLLVLTLHFMGTTLKEFQKKVRQSDINQHAEALKANPNVNNMSTQILPNITATPPSKPASKNITLTTIDLKGNTCLTPFEVHFITAPFLNTPLTNTQLFQLIQTIQMAYIKRGFTTTRVTIQHHDYTQRKLTLSIIEGTLGRIYMENNHWINRIKLWQLFPVKNDSRINDFDLRLGIVHTQRLRSLQVNTQLAPGFNRGDTNILATINRIKSPWSFYASFNGNGDHALVPSYVQLTGDHLLGVFDQWQLSYSHTILPEYHAVSNTLKVSLPIRRHWVSVHVSHKQNNSYSERYHNEYELIESQTRAYRISDDISLHYSPQAHIKLTPQLAIKESQTKQSDIIIFSNSHRQTLWGTSLSVYFQPLFNFNGSITYEKTVPWFNARSDAPTTQPDAAHYLFEKWRVSGQMAHSSEWPLLGQLASKISVSGVVCRQVIQISEQEPFGGWYSVKGFQSTSKLGENQLLLATEHLLPISQYELPNTIKNLNIELKWFLDAGILHRPHHLIPNKRGQYHALGTGVGLGFQLFSGQFDVRAAHGIASNIQIPGIETMWSWGIQF